MAGDQTGSVRDQISAQVVEGINSIRINTVTQLLNGQDAALRNAVEQIDLVRDFLGAPEKILGNPLTKHGEIAEQVEVGIRNARSLIEQQGFVATFDGVHRTAREDFLLNGVEVQSKFINGANNGLSHVLEHMDKYKDFGRGDSYYQIPKDQYETITRVMNGESGDLNGKSVRAILAKVKEIEQESGKPFQDVVKPSVQNYADPQQGKVLETLSKEEDRLTERNEQRKDQISSENGPSLAGAAQAAAIAGAVGGAVGLTTALYAKYKEGKNVFKGDFSADDWLEVGIDTGTAAVGGAIAGGSIYLMTNYASMAAPFAGAVVSAAKGVSALIVDYNANRIDLDELVSLGTVVCAESAIVGIATAAGQTLIPIPVVGAIVGSVAGKMFSELLKGQSAQLRATMDARLNEYLGAVDRQCQAVLEEILEAFDRLGDLMTAAFDIERNTQLLQSSVVLALSLGVSADVLITNHQELDAFMMG
ncbi:hypothetical protein [Pseudomonas fluorescens]|uniref:hypothetical protein n=1 Tax=Pseudomonas fluorescens TaxID=294 RepID=UPI001A9F41BF|nr:hypothetical protein [Pseudomonas fluorescens]QTD35683.1 hypothetical protein JZM58_12735 [Pseudomonas fluorescens]